ncbi:MAG: ABC transporter ATP-binding protein/permease [Defluviitaleaceae bacterium]|nr:ABC transporter ATP-binding protein/permease [Defluviitaleaceae bacterium]
MNEHEFDQVQEKHDSSGADMFGMGGEGVAEKAKDPTKTIKQLIAYLAPQKTALIIVAILAVVSTVFAVIGPRVMGRVTTILVDGIVAHILGTGLLTDFRQMRNLTIILLALYVISAACRLLQEMIMARLSVKVTYELREKISAKMHRLPINYYDTRKQGEILSRMTNDVDMISQTLSTNLTMLISAVVTLIGTFIMMISISLIMTAAALVIIPLSMWIMMIVMNKSHVFFSKQQEAVGKLNGIVEETYGSHNVVRAYNGETDALEKFRTANKDVRSAGWKAQFMQNIVEPIFGFVGNMGYVLVAVMGGWLVVQRAITIGDVQAFIQYIQTFTQPLAEIGMAGNMLQGTVAAAERVFEFLGEEEETPDPEISAHKDKYEGAVSFQNVRFGYNPDKIILHDFSKNVKPGQKVAIVGPTGAGKTTVVKLLMRFYEINSGKILIDGIDSTDFSRSELRDIFGMVLQDTWLYNATIMENIRYGSPDATDEEVIAAAKAAHCHKFIRTLPGGYNMILNEEASNISQGQKQLFTIARVILKDPAILILDEATSSIDTRTEVLIQGAMRELMRGRTSFVIAHRLSTIRDADVIFVMKEGDIIEQGSHEKLLEANGFYADLYNSQFHGE